MKKEKLCSVSALIFVLLLSVNFIVAQDKNAPVNIKTNLIVLDSDKQNVDDVKQTDVKIFEDGVEQKITYFAKKEPILNVGLVVDNSGSLRTVFHDIVFMSSTIVENLRPDDEAFVVRFTSRDNIQSIQDWTSDKRKLRNATANMYVEGGQTAILDAVYLSAEALLERAKQDKSKRYALILISDAAERSSHYKLDELFALVKDSDVQIFTVSMPEEYAVKNNGNQGKILLLNNTLATETGGTAYTLSKKYSREELLGYLKAIVTELRSNYIVGYTSTNQKRDGKVRNLRVEIADGEGGAKRSGYVREKFKVLNTKDITK